MKQNISVETLFWEIVLSVKWFAKMNKNNTLSTNVMLHWESLWKEHDNLLLNNETNGIKIWEQNAEEERSDGPDSLCEAEQETTQEPHEAQVQKEGDGELSTVLQNAEEQMIEVPDIQHAGSEW